MKQAKTRTCAATYKLMVPIVDKKFDRARLKKLSIFIACRKNTNLHHNYHHMYRAYNTIH